MAENATTAIRTAQVLGITGAGFMAGMVANFSFIAAPAMVSTLSSSSTASLPPSATSNPLTVARQWQHMYKRGMVSMPPFAIACSTCFALLAYQHWPKAVPSRRGNLPAPGYLYAIAAVLIPSIVPYTILLIMPTNDALEEIAASGMGAKDSVAASGEELGRLVWKWSLLNYGRTVMVTAGALIGGVATMTAA